MPLCQPSIVGPLSELSTSIRVQGQLVGALVTVFSLKPQQHEVAKGIATASDQRFKLLAGVQLSAQDVLVASQELNAQQSGVPSGAQGVWVQPKPQNASAIGTVGLETHPYECARYVWVSGAIPGATVEVVANNQVLGSDVAHEGNAMFGLAQALPQGVPIKIHQVVPQLATGPDITRMPDPLPGKVSDPLTPPVLLPPIQKCDSSVKVKGVIDGALVTIEGSASAGSPAFTISGGAYRSHGYIPLHRELDQGQNLVIRQDVAIECERFGMFSIPLTVGPMQPLAAPVIHGPLCAGTQTVRVENLRPGALVHLSIDADVFDGQAPPGVTSFDFGVPPLPGGAEVSATQEVCHVVSFPSSSVGVGPLPANIPQPEIVGPLFDCARAVSVTGVHPGATIQIFAQSANGISPISNLVALYDTQGTIPVAPYLHVGDDIYAVEWACGNAPIASKTVQVQPWPSLLTVVPAAPILAGDTIVQVQYPRAGALVEVYVQRKNVGTLFAGSAVANGLSPVPLPGAGMGCVTAVPCNMALQADDGVVARQTLCGATSDPGRPVTVMTAPRFGPRPFYIIGHNPNTIDEVKEVLKAGANAIEPDVNAYTNKPGELCISHGTGADNAPSLEKFLKDLHDVAFNNPKLALVIFDCKPGAALAVANYGADLLGAIRTHLTYDIPLNVIISVATFADTAIFNNMDIHNLGPREGVMIDEENDPLAVSNSLGQADHQCFGNGIAFWNNILGPNIRPSLEHACKLRASDNRLKFIYTWAVNNDEHQREYIRIGLDGIITDEIAELIAITKEPEFNVKFAIRDDNPFQPANFAYGLSVHTGDNGTDANITFVLKGSKGEASKTVNTDWPYRMEADDWNYVTIESQDLGDLQSITVLRDDQGNYPDWFLRRILVSSFRFGVVQKQADFDCLIDTAGLPFTRPLV